MMSVLSLLILLIAVFTSNAFRVSSSIGAGALALAGPGQNPNSISIKTLSCIQTIRGGDSDSDSEYDQEEEDEEEDVKLSASAVSALKKAKAKKKAATKKTVSASLKTTSPKKKKSGVGGSVAKKIPYIIKALLNPFVVFAMMKGYFASLFNIDFGHEVRRRRRRKLLIHPVEEVERASKRAYLRNLLCPWSIELHLIHLTLPYPNQPNPLSWNSRMYPKPWDRHSKKKQSLLHHPEREQGRWNLVKPRPCLIFQ